MKRRMVAMWECEGCGAVFEEQDQCWACEQQHPPQGMTTKEEQPMTTKQTITQQHAVQLANMVLTADSAWPGNIQEAALDVRDARSPRKFAQYAHYLVTCVRCELQPPMGPDLPIEELLERARAMGDASRPLADPVGGKPELARIPVQVEAPMIIIATQPDGGPAPRSLADAVPRIQDGVDLARLPGQARAGRGAAAVATITGQAGRHLGDLVGWSLRGVGRGLPADRCRELAEHYGIADAMEACWPRLTAGGAYRMAVRYLTTRQATDARVIEAIRVEERKDRVVHEVVSRGVTATGGDALSDRAAQFQRTLRVAWDKVAGCVRADPPDHPLALEIVDLQRHFLTHYTADDIRVSFQRAMERAWNAYPLLAHGGTWFVLAPYADRVRAWADFMRELGCAPLVIPLFDTVESLAALRQAAEESIEGQLAAVREEAERFQSSALARASTLEARVEAFDQLRARADLYERVLGASVADLRASIEAARLGLVATLARRQGDSTCDPADPAGEVAP